MVGWQSNADQISLTRCFESTSHELEQLFKPGGQVALQKLREIPTLFASEIGGSGSQQARVGRITNARIVDNDLHFEYSLEAGIPPVANSKLQEIRRELGIDSFEFTRSHWAIKDVDLYRVLFKHHAANLLAPKVFRLDAVDETDKNLVSLMMPFERRFDDVQAALVQAAGRHGMQCLRADDIWNHDAIIQDIFSLINRSRIVICDCTGRNANVFYETGIAHCLGKDVILVTQNEADIPFDLRHLRYVHYLPNGEGLQRLIEQVADRITTLRAR